MRNIRKKNFVQMIRCVFIGCLLIFTTPIHVHSEKGEDDITGNRSYTLSISQSNGRISLYSDKEMPNLHITIVNQIGDTIQEEFVDLQPGIPYYLTLTDLSVSCAYNLLIWKNNQIVESYILHR